MRTAHGNPGTPKKLLRSISTSNSSIAPAKASFHIIQISGAVRYTLATYKANSSAASVPGCLITPQTSIPTGIEFSTFLFHHELCVLSQHTTHPLGFPHTHVRRTHISWIAWLHGHCRTPIPNVIYACRVLVYAFEGAHLCYPNKCYDSTDTGRTLYRVLPKAGLSGLSLQPRSRHDLCTKS